MTPEDIFQNLESSLAAQIQVMSAKAQDKALARMTTVTARLLDVIANSNLGLAEQLSVAAMFQDNVQRTVLSYAREYLPEHETIN
jgi:hypothetical protein